MIGRPLKAPAEGAAVAALKRLQRFDFECRRDGIEPLPAGVVKIIDIALAASPDVQPKGMPPESVVPRLEWCAATLRDVADRGRAGLGDSYPVILSVLGAVKAVLEVHATQTPAPAPEVPAQSVKSEREAFDAWVLTVPYVHTPWMAWMKRAALAAQLTQAPAVAPGTGDTNGRRDGLRPALHGGVAMGGHTPGALADLLFASHDVMSLNAELDLTMGQLVRLAQAVLIATRVASGLSPAQEPKYTVNGHAIVNRASGEEIPADEPVFIFRARDKWAAGVLGDYCGQFCNDPEHIAAVEARFIQFSEWAEAHPERMKEPDTAPSKPPVQGSQP